MLPYDLLPELPAASPVQRAGHAPSVDIWSWVYRPEQIDWDKIKSGLTHEEQDRAANFHFKKDSIAFMAGRYLQRSVLASYLGIAGEYVKIAAGEHGKPYLADKPMLTFNLSNTDGLAVLVVSRDCLAVGVDAEDASTVLEAETAPIFCSANERATLSALQGTEQQSLLLAYWTLKESFLKATGHGLNIDPHLLDVQVDATTRKIRIEHPLPVGGANWHRRLFRSAGGYLIAVSAQSDRTELQFHQHGLPDPI